jgi:hypothetical protein
MEVIARGIYVLTSRVVGPQVPSLDVVQELLGGKGPREF